MMADSTGTETTATEVGQEEAPKEIVTTTATEFRPAVVEPATPLDGPRISLYTSLSSGSSSAVSAQLRIETMLKANKIRYELVDLATDERAKKVWRRRGQGKKLPGVVRMDEDGDETLVGTLEELEEANEYGELKQLVLGTGK